MKKVGHPARGLMITRGVTRVLKRGLALSSFGFDLIGRPYPIKRCDAEGCEATATLHCSFHGVHFCERHLELHRLEWHSCGWETPMGVARC